MIVFSKKDCSSVRKLVEYIPLIIRPNCAKTFDAKEGNKLQMQVKIGITFHRDEITFLEMNRLYAYVKKIQQADYMRRNSLLIKVQV